MFSLPHNKQVLSVGVALDVNVGTCLFGLMGSRPGRFFVGRGLSGLGPQVEEIEEDLVVWHIRVLLAVSLPLKHGCGIQLHLQ